MIIVLSALLIAGIFFYVLFVRTSDIPEPLPVSPVQHLEDRKSAIYDNLRDLQFEYRLGKLSDDDYQRTKVTLQKELAGVLAEIEATMKSLGLLMRTAAPQSKAQVQAVKSQAAKNQQARGQTKCPHCGATFPRSMHYCGECGKAMTA
jgi:hypothetical protein